MATREEPEAPSGGRLVAIEDAGRRGDPGGTLALLPGSLAAVLVVTDLGLEELPPGTRLRVGERAVVELAGPAGAGGMRERGEGAPTLAVRVLEGGPVRVGDAVVVEAVPVPLEESLDLHSFRPGEVADVVAEYLARARAAGLREVRLIHGRGQGVQRAIVRRLLAGSPAVEAFADAPPERGGWGATVVRLRPTSGVAP